jgi:hypothetical protein
MILVVVCQTTLARGNMLTTTTLQQQPRTKSYNTTHIFIIIHHDEHIVSMDNGIEVSLAQLHDSHSRRFRHPQIPSLAKDKEEARLRQLHCSYFDNVIVMYTPISGFDQSSWCSTDRCIARATL